MKFFADLTFAHIPLDSDTDNDGLTDGEEHYNYETDPIDSDSDDDGLSDGLEVGISDLDIFDNEFNSNSCATKNGKTPTPIVMKLGNLMKMIYPQLTLK